MVLVSTALMLGDIKIFDSHARDMYHNSHSEGTCVLLEIPSMNLKVYILPPLKLIFSQAMLNIVVYQMLTATNLSVNSATL